MSDLVKHVPDQSAFSMQSFEHAQRVAKMLCSSDLIPAAYRNNIQNTMIALEMANRIGASPLMVMQNLNIIQGKPSWGSSFIIAVINNCGKFTPLRFVKTGTGETMTCYATAQDKITGEALDGPVITMAMAKAEGWIDKSGSKWKTMPELMIRYRAAAFFGRLYAPELLMGMHSVEEINDTVKEKKQPEKIVESRIAMMINDAETLEELERLKTDLPESLYDLYNAKAVDLTTV